MTSRDFCYWLQGYFEIDAMVAKGEHRSLNAEQIDMIKTHLAMVFKHEIDPSMGDEKHQEDLNQIHNPSGINPGPYYSDTAKPPAMTPGAYRPHTIYPSDRKIMC